MPNKNGNTQDRWKEIARKMIADSSYRDRVLSLISDKKKEKATDSQNKILEKAANIYHNNADKIPPVLHRAIYNTIKESSWSEEPLKELAYNFLPNLRENKAAPADNMFLMSPSQQKDALSAIGYIPVDTSGGYGLVNAAVNRYKLATGRDVPMYQYGKDDISRDSLIPLNNTLLSNFSPYTVHVLSYLEDGSPSESIPISDVDLGDAGSFPTRLYRDSDGNLYYKQWDFFDHGDYSRKKYSDSDSQYDVKALTSNSQKYGNLLDIAGNPFVKTTGYRKIQENGLNDALNLLLEQEGKDYIYSFDDGYEELKNKMLSDIKSGKYDIKAMGGNLYKDGGKKKEYAPSEELIQYLMSTESFLDRPSNKLDGKWTIGFGDTDKALNDYYLKNPKARYSRKDAEKRLRERVSNEFLPQLAKTVPNWDRLTDAQKDSLLSYAYNVGKYFVSTHKNFAKAMQDFDLARAAAELNASENDRRYPGIKIRRAIEKAAFLDPSISVFGGSPSKARPVASSYDWNSAPWYRYPVSSGEGPSINMTPVKMRSDDEIFGVRDTRGPLSYDVSAPAQEVPVQAPVQPKMSNVDMVLSEYLPEFQRGVLLQTYGNMRGSGGKIHIKPSKKGTFTAAAKKHGKSVQAFASQVLANKDNYSPAMVKKANFARNAAKWHAEGGLLDRLSSIYNKDRKAMIDAVKSAKLNKL